MNPWQPASVDEWLPRRLRLCWGGDGGDGGNGGDGGGGGFGDSLGGDFGGATTGGGDWGSAGAFDASGFSEAGNFDMAQSLAADMAMGGLPGVSTGPGEWGGWGQWASTDAAGNVVANDLAGNFASFNAQNPSFADVGGPNPGVTTGGGDWGSAGSFSAANTGGGPGGSFSAASGLGSFIGDNTGGGYGGGLSSGTIGNVFGAEPAGGPSDIGGSIGAAYGGTYGAPFSGEAAPIGGAAPASVEDVSHGEAAPIGGAAPAPAEDVSHGEAAPLGGAAPAPAEEDTHGEAAPLGGAAPAPSEQVSQEEDTHGEAAPLGGAPAPSEEDQGDKGGEAAPLGGAAPAAPEAFGPQSVAAPEAATRGPAETMQELSALSNSLDSYDQTGEGPGGPAYSDSFAAAPAGGRSTADFNQAFGAFDTPSGQDLAADQGPGEGRGGPTSSDFGQNFAHDLQTLSDLTQSVQQPAYSPDFNQTFSAVAPTYSPDFNQAFGAFNATTAPGWDTAQQTAGVHGLAEPTDWGANPLTSDLAYQAGQLDVGRSIADPNLTPALQEVNSFFYGPENIAEPGVVGGGRGADIAFTAAPLAAGLPGVGTLGGALAESVLGHLGAIGALSFLNQQQPIAPDPGVIVDPTYEALTSQPTISVELAPAQEQAQQEQAQQEQAQQEQAQTQQQQTTPETQQATPTETQQQTPQEQQQQAAPEAQQQTPAEVQQETAQEQQQAQPQEVQQQPQTELPPEYSGAPYVSPQSLVDLAEPQATVSVAPPNVQVPPNNPYGYTGPVTDPSREMVPGGRGGRNDDLPPTTWTQQDQQRLTQRVQEIKSLPTIAQQRAAVAGWPAWQAKELSRQNDRIVYPGNQPADMRGRPTAGQLGIQPTFQTRGLPWERVDAELISRANALHQAMPKALQPFWVMSDGYRGYLHQSNIVSRGVRPAAGAGHSNHQLGNALDFLGRQGSGSPYAQAQAWARAHAREFGLYPLRGDFPHLQLMEGTGHVRNGAEVNSRIAATGWTPAQSLPGARQQTAAPIRPPAPVPQPGAPGPMSQVVRDITPTQAPTQQQQQGGQPGRSYVNGKEFSFYAPGAKGKTEGKYQVQFPTKGQPNQPKTLDDVRAGRSNYVTLAGHPDQRGREISVGNVTYTSPKDGKTYTLPNVRGVVEDSGSDFRGNNNPNQNKFDIAVGDFRGWSGSRGSNFVANNSVTASQQTAAAPAAAPQPVAPPNVAPPAPTLVPPARGMPDAALMGRTAMQIATDMATKGPRPSSMAEGQAALSSLAAALGRAGIPASIAARTVLEIARAGSRAAGYNPDGIASSYITSMVGAAMRGYQTAAPGPVQGPPRMLAEGGRVKKNEGVIVGEQGPEYFVPDTPGTVYPYMPPGSRGDDFGGWPKAPTPDYPGHYAGLGREIARQTYAAEQPGIFELMRQGKFRINPAAWENFLRNTPHSTNIEDRRNWPPATPDDETVGLLQMR